MRRRIFRVGKLWVTNWESIYLPRNHHEFQNLILILWMTFKNSLKLLLGHFDQEIIKDLATICEIGVKGGDVRECLLKIEVWLEDKGWTIGELCNNFRECRKCRNDIKGWILDKVLAPALIILAQEVNDSFLTDVYGQIEGWESFRPEPHES